MHFYIIANIIGTLLGIRYGTHARTFIRSMAGKTHKRKAFELSLYLVIATFIWIPTLIIRFGKTMRRTWNHPSITQA